MVIERVFQYHNCSETNGYRKNAAIISFSETFDDR